MRRRKTPKPRSSPLAPCARRLAAVAAVLAAALGAHFAAAPSRAADAETETEKPVETSRPPLDLDALLGVIVPSASEVAWLEIPWEVDLLTARRRAEREGKPLFLWEMDGHPLGCT